MTARRPLLLVALLALVVSLLSSLPAAASAGTASTGTIKVKVKRDIGGQLTLYRVTSSGLVPEYTDYFSRGTATRKVKVPTGRYKIALASNTWFGGVSSASAKQVVVKKNRTTSVAKSIGYPLTIDERAVDETGKLLSHVLLMLYRSDAKDEVIGAGWGRMRLDGVAQSRDRGALIVKYVDPTGLYRDRVAEVGTDPVMVRDRPLSGGPRNGVVTGSTDREDDEVQVCFVPVDGGIVDERCSRAPTHTHRYRVDQLVPGDYKVRYARLWAEKAWLGGPTFERATAVTVPAAGAIELDLPRTPPIGSIVGEVVVAASVRSPAGLQADLHALDDPDHPITSVPVEWSDGAYRYTFMGLPVGDYRLRITDASDQFAPVWVGGSSHATAKTVAVDDVRLTTPDRVRVGVSAVDTRPVFPAPTGLREQHVGVQYVPVLWDPVEGADVYRLQWSTDPAMRRGVSSRLTRVRPDEHITVGPLKSGTRYYSRIAVVDWGGRQLSPYSAITAVDPSTATALPAPTGLRVTREDKGVVELAWDPVPGAFHYTLQLDDGSGWKTPKAVWKSDDRRIARVTDLVSGRSYRFRVAVIDLHSKDGYLSPFSDSTPVGVPTDDHFLPAPANVEVEAIGTSIIEVTWDPVPGAAIYQVTYSTNIDSHAVNQQRKDVRTNRAKLEFLEPGTRYEVVVRVRHEEFESVYLSDRQAKPYPSATTAPLWP